MFKIEFQCCAFKVHKFKLVTIATSEPCHLINILLSFFFSFINFDVIAFK